MLMYKNVLCQSTTLSGYISLGVNEAVALQQIIYF